ncbi:hypothetical protein FC764_10220 [Clostridium botulinum]|nr:hypothetical protein [Clostridium botulinum]
MNNRKVIENIEPFNDAYYKYCFFNSLFPIIAHFKRDILEFLINDVLVYKDDEFTKLRFNSDYLPIYSFERMCCGELGIKFDYKKECEDIVTHTISSIDKNRPVIVLVDCFYEKIRPEMYGKIHWFHTLTVYGYDKEIEMFDIIEHQHKDNLDYKKRKISFNELADSNLGYFRNFHDKIKREPFFSFYLDEEHNENYIRMNEDELKDKFKSNMILRKKEILEGILKLESFGEMLKEIVEDEDKLKEYAEDIVNITNNIINCKRVEMYKVENIFPDKYEMSNLINIIIDNWSKIRKIIGKYLFSEIYKSTNLKKIHELVDDIIDLEQIYVSKI